MGRAAVGSGQHPFPSMPLVQAVPGSLCPKLHYSVLSVSKVQGAEIIGKLENNVDGDTATAGDWCYYG